MKFNIVWAGMLLALLLLPACKKEESTETKPSLSGLSITAALPFVRSGVTLEFSADISDVVSSDESKTPETIGLAWQVNSDIKDTLTTNARVANPVFRYTVTEEGNYSVTCFAFAGSEFYSTSASTTFQVINPDTAIEGLSDKTQVNLGGQTWMSRNLHDTEIGHDYEGCEVVSPLFGRYYTWEEAITACPAGWHLPTAEEFDAAVSDNAGDLMADAVFLGSHMWPYWPEVPITNALGFNAIPVGYIDFAGSGSAVPTYLSYACWWTASETENGMGVFRYIFEQSPLVQKGQGSKTSLAMSVRCVKD